MERIFIKVGNTQVNCFPHCRYGQYVDECFDPKLLNIQVIGDEEVLYIECCRAPGTPLQPDLRTPRVCKHLNTDIKIRELEV